MEQWEPAIDCANKAIDTGCKNEKALGSVFIVVCKFDLIMAHYWSRTITKYLERRAFASSQIDEKLDTSLADYKTLYERFPQRTHYAQKIYEVSAYPFSLLK